MKSNVSPRMVMITRAAVAAVAAWLSAGVPGQACATQPAYNAVADWDANTLNAVVTTAKKGPPVAPIYFAYVSVAMFDAANSIEHRHRPFAVSVRAPRDASIDAAVTAAAHDVLVHYFPAQQVTLDAEQSTSLSMLPEGHARASGVAVGQEVAARWLSMRQADGLEAPIVYTPSHGPGIWEPVPTFPAPPPNTPPPPVAPWLAQFQPFALRSAEQFLDDVRPPLALDSKAWARDFNLTKNYGARNSTYRTPQQTEIGLFWSDHPSAQYSRALRELIRTEHLRTAQAARLEVMFNVVYADSVTACLNAKYHFAFWRPYTAIHDADTDGNDATVPDPDWIPLDPTPGHPEYPAAHGCVTQAAMDALTEFFDTDDVPFTVASTVTGTTHQFASFEDVVQEVDVARIYGGMHFRRSVKEGNRLGGRVADYVLRHRFRDDDGHGR
jgi:hypothetical protein